MSVILPFPINEIEKQAEQPSLTYKLDFEKRRIVGLADGLEAINQFIHKALISPRFRCLIYDNQYGSELKETIIAANVSPEFVEAEIPRLVKDALLVDSRILSVYDFSISQKGEVVNITFKANTVFGETVVEVIEEVQ